jgi:Domain of unknown function (DUF4062)
MDKRYTVFVSSTYKDLVDARWAVARALMRLNLIPLGMEAFTASDKSQWEIIKRTIDLSDYYVLILGNCYGSIDPETDISYTEKEYRYALAHGIPCLTSISKDMPLKPEHRESDRHLEKLTALRAEVSASRMVDFWTNADELTVKVTTALVMAQVETPRPGWVRNPQSSPEVAEELARLSRRNAELERELKTAETSVVNIESKVLGNGVVFLHDGSSKGQINIKIRVSNIGSVAVSRVGISLFIKPIVEGKLGIFERQDSFKDLAPGEHLDTKIEFIDLDLNNFPEDVTLVYSVTGLNIASPIKHERAYKVHFMEYDGRDYSHYE